MKKKTASWKKWKILAIIKIMKKTVIYLGLFILASGVTWFLADRFYQKKINLLLEEKAICQKELTQKKEPLSTLNDVYLLAQKEKVLASVKKSLLNFSADTEKISQNKWKVIIKLEGDSQSAADAADLKLDLPRSSVVSDLKTGPAFPIYPRQIINDSFILVTGLASFDKNQFVLAQPQKLFVEFTIQISNLSQDNNQININKTDTKIFLSGENIYDSNKSFNQIILQ